MKPLVTIPEPLASRVLEIKHARQRRGLNQKQGGAVTDVVLDCIEAGIDRVEAAETAVVVIDGSKD